MWKPEHKPFMLEHYYVPGRDTSPIRRPTHIHPFKLMKPIHATAISSFEEYMLGCNLHEGCKGGVCSTSKGVLLVPPGFVTTQGMYSNHFSNIAKDVFSQYMPADSPKPFAKDGHEEGELV